MSFKNEYNPPGCEENWRGPPLSPQQVSLPAAATAEVPDVLGDLPHDKWQKVRAAWPGTWGTVPLHRAASPLACGSSGPNGSHNPPPPDPAAFPRWHLKPLPRHPAVDQRRSQVASHRIATLQPQEITQQISVKGPHRFGFSHCNNEWRHTASLLYFVD